MAGIVRVKPISYLVDLIFHSFKLMKSHIPFSTSSSLLLRVQFHCESQNYADSKAMADPELFLRWVRYKCRVGFSNLEQALSFYHEMMSLRPVPCIVDFNHLFSAIVKLKEPYRPRSTMVVLSLYRDLELLGIRPNLDSIDILINCSCQLGRVNLGYLLLGKRLKLGCPYVYYYSAHNNPLGKYLIYFVKLWPEPDQVIRNTNNASECESTTTKRNVTSYSTLFEFFSKYRHGMLNEDSHKHNCEMLNLDIFSNIMESKGVSPNIITYASLFAGLCSFGRWEKAKALLTEMWEWGMFHNLQTLNILIDMFCKQGWVDVGHVIFQFIIQRGESPDIFTYNSLLEGYCLFGRMDEAAKLVHVMEESGCHPNVVTFNTLINGYIKAYSIDKAVQVFQDMCSSEGISPNAVTYNTLIDGLCTYDRLPLARQLFHDTKVHGVNLDSVAYASLLDRLSENEQLDEAWEVLCQMKDKGVVIPNNSIRNMVRQGYLKMQWGWPTDFSQILVPTIQ